LLTAVAPVIHAEILQPSSGSIESVETNIVYRLKSVIMAGREPILTELKKQLSQLGVDWCRFILSTGNSIESYFLCDSMEQLKALREHYESGLMRVVLEGIFTLLADEDITIHELKWPTAKYSDHLIQLG
jgi:hypothetical protein